MLQQIMDNVHNYFIKEAVVGSYEIADGMISLPFVKEGQRFWITNSDFNDGVYTYYESGIRNDDDSEAAGLHDETFTGTICALAVPPAVNALSGEIKAWVANHQQALESPYQSENVIGVYSYTKANGGSGAGGSVGWQDVYKTQLDRWRRVSF